MVTSNDTTSQHFCCNTCGAAVALVELPGGDLAYECQNARCCRTVSVDCPEALALRAELTIELPTPRQLGARIAAQRATHEVR